MATLAHYQRAWRERNPDRQRELQRRQAARIAAAIEVADRYPNLWRDAFERICYDRGIDPYPPVGRPPTAPRP